MLVVEDDRDIRTIVTHVLTAGGYQVVPASNGEEALAHLRDGMEPCLILLDLMMPGMDGYQFRERQLKDPGFSVVPVIVCSGCSQLEHRAAALTAAAYLDKPFNFRELLRLVDMHRRRDEMAHPEESSV